MHLRLLHLLRVVAASLLHVRVVGLRLAPHVKFETLALARSHHLAVLRVAELVWLLLAVVVPSAVVRLVLVCVVAALRSVVRDFAYDTEQQTQEIFKQNSLTYLFDC